MCRNSISLILFYTGYFNKAIYVGEGLGDQNASSIKFLNQMSWKHTIWHAGWVLTKLFYCRKIGFELIASS